MSSEQQQQPMDFIDQMLIAPFPDEDFSDVFNDIEFNPNQAVQDDTIDDLLMFPQLNEADGINTETALGDDTRELTYLEPELLEDLIRILDIEQIDADPLEYQTPPIIHNPVLQAYGSQNGMMYQIHPTLFSSIFGNMSVKQQPKANNRSRYACDGRRFLPDSRYHPMTIELPNLQSITLGQNQILGLVMTIVTGTNNPMAQTIVHTNDVTCEEDGVIKLGYGCIFVPLKTSEIDAFQKKFSRVSILYKKYEEYTFRLTPFDLNTMFGPTETYNVPNHPNMDKVPKGKRFKTEYNLSFYKFAFHLAMKQDNLVYVSNITCETDVIDETVIIPTKSKKRTATDSIEHPSDDEVSSDSQQSNSAKRSRSSTLQPVCGLPVTHISGDHAYSNMNDYNAPS